MPDEIATRILGRTGIAVTTLGYGAMALDRDRMTPRGLAVADETAGAVLNAVLDAGINFIDTAPDYGNSEELIGRFIANRRGEYFLASKAGCPVAVPADAGPGHVYTPENIRAGVERSLARMHTDYLDIVQFHGGPPPDLEAGAIDTLLTLKKEGKLRFIGVSSTQPSLRHHIDLGLFDVFQIPYSVVQPEHGPLIGSAAEAGGGTVIRGGVARGAPSAEKDWQISLPDRTAKTPKDWWVEAKIDDLLDGMSAMEFVLRFTLSHPTVHTVIVGTGKTEHLAENLAAAKKGPLPGDLYAEVSRRIEAVEAAG